jgi:hypothetical protein
MNKSASEAPTQELLGTTESAYVGRRTPFGPAVFVAEGKVGHPLPLSDAFPVRAYSWGTPGSKPVALAYAILRDATGDELLSERLCRAFTWQVVGALPADYFRLERTEVLAWVDDFRFVETPVR